MYQSMKTGFRIEKIRSLPRKIVVKLNIDIIWRIRILSIKFYLCFQTENQMSEDFMNSDLTLGILGGGQLGRMLIQQAMDWNLRTRVLDKDENAPCKKIADRFVNGSYADRDVVYEFGKECTVVTVEIEHVNVQALEDLEKEGIRVCPSSGILKIVQDKGLQKMFYRENEIPTADFFLVENREQVMKYKNECPFYQKLRRLGYDGRGVKWLPNEATLHSAFDEPSVLEKAVDCEKEISVIVARNRNEEVKLFPPVEMQFSSEAHLLELLISPARISERVSVQAAEIAIKIANALQLVGVLAVEMFLSRNGQLLVNEIAPRPHNSGHHTIEGNVCSQYEQHLRAIFNLPLGDTSVLKPSVMVNLLGEKGCEGPAVYEGMDKALKLPGVYVHLYGKKYTRPFRKMGHVTITDEKVELAIEKAMYVKKTLKVRTI